GVDLVVGQPRLATPAEEEVRPEQEPDGDAHAVGGDRQRPEVDPDQGVVTQVGEHQGDHQGHAKGWAPQTMRSSLRYTRFGASSWAAGWGVVTTITSARGRNCDIDRATSPVPGGMSTIRNWGSSHHTSVRNCSRALWSIGPRQMTGWSSRAKKPIDTSLTPW